MYGTHKSDDVPSHADLRQQELPPNEMWSKWKNEAWTIDEVMAARLARTGMLLTPFGDYDPDDSAVVTATEEEKHEAVERGLSGGRLPDSFSSVDCEMYAILAYLRSQLGLVVFLWIKSHNGASTSSYPDLAAKMYLQAPQEDEITKIVGDLVYTRPCVYERHMTSEDEEGSERWGLADRKVYKEGRLRARGSVRARLAELLKPGATTAGETRPLWTQIVKAAMRRPDADGGMIGLEQVKDYNTRTKVVMAARSKNTPGMPHDAAWARIHRVELTNGENGTASISRSWGCALCRRKKNTDIEKRNMGRRRQDRRDRQGWKDYDDEAEVCANTMSSTRHTLTGLCAGTDAELVVSMQRHMTSLHKEAEKAANSGGGAGTDVMGVLDLAKEAVDAVALGNVVSDAQYVALNQTIASTLPVWKRSDRTLSCVHSDNGCETACM